MHIIQHIIIADIESNIYPQKHKILVNILFVSSNFSYIDLILNKLSALLVLNILKKMK